MGMRIDTAINNLSMYSIDEYGNAELRTWYNGIGKDMEESFMLAIEIMRKYQKIQEIMAKRPKDMIISNPTLRAINEVLKDGNDNRDR